MIDLTGDGSHQVFFNKVVFMNPTVRRILELFGAVESRETVVRRKLALASQAKPQGKTSLIVRSAGKKQNSILSVIRSMTGLETEEVLTLLRSLPAPVLIHVSPETAVAAQKALVRLGVDTEIIGLPSGELEALVRIIEAPQEKPSGRVKGMKIRQGPFVVTLTTIGLLGDRVLDGVQRITGDTIPALADLEQKLPVVLLRGVDEETAVKAQTLLQMVGAVVEIDQRPEEFPASE
jgi:ribosomal protein L7/L12